MMLAIDRSSAWSVSEHSSTESSAATWQGQVPPPDPDGAVELLQPVEIEMLASPVLPERGEQGLLVRVALRQGSRGGQDVRLAQDRPPTCALRVATSRAPRAGRPRATGA